MGNKPLDDGYDALPPSFLPASHDTRPADIPRSTPRRSGNTDGRDLPGSFQPRRTGTQGAAAPARAPRSSSSRRTAASPSPAPAARPSASQEPPSFQPRNTAGSSARVRRGASADHGGAAGTPARSFPGTPARSSFPPRDSSPRATGAAVRMSRRGPRVGRMLAAALVVLLVAAAIGAFSAYRWVDGQLNHFDALTDHADGAESTWLIVGSDARDGTAGGTADDVPGERTDTIMLLIKPKSGPAALVSIPRDSYVNLDGQDMKINAAVMLGGGWPALSGAVEQLTDTKVDHVVKIGFKGVKDVVDAIGGINVCYDGDVSDPDSGMEWTAGCHDVNGDQALAFARMRYQDPEGDIGRAKRQRQVIQKIAAKAASKETLGNFSKTKALIQAGLSNVDVDEDATPKSLMDMALAFRDATGKDGITGTAAIANVDYWPDSGIGSTVLLDDEANTTLFRQLRDGTHEPGTVGGTSVS